MRRRSLILRRSAPSSAEWARQKDLLIGVGAGSEVTADVKAIADPTFDAATSPDRQDAEPAIAEASVAPTGPAPASDVVLADDVVLANGGVDPAAPAAESLPAIADPARPIAEVTATAAETPEVGAASSIPEPSVAESVPNESGAVLLPADEPGVDAFAEPEQPTPSIDDVGATLGDVG